MLFNSFSFLILLFITFLIYYTPFFKRFQVSILIISSCIFYANHNPQLLILLIVSIAINVFTSYTIQFGPKKGQYRIAALGVVANLGTLIFFKYAGLFAKTFLSQQSELHDTLIAIPLPIGISFFTFQGVSLMIDTFRSRNSIKEDILVEKNFWKHGLNTFFFISFFPQLIAGPIVKAYEFLPQIKSKYLNDINWAQCFKHLILGYFLKMVVADNMKDFTFNIQYPYFIELSSLELLVLLFGYSVQIFADFAAYSTIAIGVSGLFGYKIPENFNFPYISQTFSEFWRRWHISLSTFLKEYLYIPLGGNKKGKYRTYFNLFITMTLGGIWHGAAWSYALWGIYHGSLLILERLLDSDRKEGTLIHRLTKMFVVFSLVTFGWLLFKLPVFSEVLLFLKAIGKNQFLPQQYHILIYVFIYAFPVFLYHLYQFLKENRADVILFRINLKPIWYAFMLFFIITNYGSSSTFIYFQF